MICDHARISYLKTKRGNYDNTNFKRSEIEFVSVEILETDAYQNLQPYEKLVSDLSGALSR